MIFEYALEPELVATWGAPHSARFFLRQFGLGQGRLVSRYPKSWDKKVYDSFRGSDMGKKQLEELLSQLKETMVKRKEYCWENSRGDWLENALDEHNRYPFQAIMARQNPKNLPQIICEDDLSTPSCKNWDIPHGITIKRNAFDMAGAIEMMLACCQWVKLIDPHLSPGKLSYRLSLQTFLTILASKRPVGPIEAIEIHTRKHEGTVGFLRKSYEEIIPAGLTVTLFQWQEKPGGQKLHNRYILTNLGGVSFLHGLDTGKEGETDDLNRLDKNQFELRYSQYNTATSAFEEAAMPMKLLGKRER